MDILWNDKMATGVKEVDDAHKLLIVWINKLNGDMKSGNGRKEILTVLNYLEKYVTLHFAHEEGCMIQYQCPSAQSNKKAHEEFVEFFKRMKNKIELEGPTVKSVFEIKDAMGDWLKNHIMKTDICLAQCVKDGVTTVVE